MDDRAQPLRARKKAAAMRRIQAEATRLFTERGFDAVTIEHVADAADVSPSTVYRYFGTKEELVMRDEYDDRLRTALTEALLASDAPPVTAVRSALAAIYDNHFVRDKDATLARSKLWQETPAIQAATYLVTAEATEFGAQALAQTRGLELNKARLISTAIIHTLLASVLNWHADGGTRPWQTYAEEALDLLERGLGE